MDIVLAGGPTVNKCQSKKDAERGKNTIAWWCYKRIFN